MANVRTSKTLAERIDINYWTHSHPWRRWRQWVTAVVGVSAALWLLCAAVMGNRRIYEAGPLSRAHTMIGDKCAQCHTESWQPAIRIVTGDPKRRSVPDANCLVCHDGADHNEQQVASDVPGCAICHHEHRGAAVLSQIPDSKCVYCHANLQTSSGTLTFDSHVEQFGPRDRTAAGHPEFALIRDGRADSAAIKLNHAVHLRPDGVTSSGSHREVLKCSDCHKPDVERRGMLPVRYEEHCSRCHSNALLFDVTRLAQSPAPHREAETVVAIVRHRYLEYASAHGMRPGDMLAPSTGWTRRMPGRPVPESVAEPEWEWVRYQVDRASQVLFQGAGGCRFCHTVESGESRWKVVTPEIPGRWLTHSQFSHDSHRFLGCTECHPAQNSTATSDVLIPSIQTCFGCHGTRGGARGDCVECHRYHDRSREREPNGPLTRQGSPRI